MVPASQLLCGLSMYVSSLLKPLQHLHSCNLSTGAGDADLHSCRLSLELLCQLRT